MVVSQVLRFRVMCAIVEVDLHTYVDESSLHGRHAVFWSCLGLPSTKSPCCPGVGGAMTAGGITMMTWCSFHSNYATSRGLAIAAVSSTVYITAAWFKSNELYCEADLYRHDEVRRN